MKMTENLLRIHCQPTAGQERGTHHPGMDGMVAVAAETEQIDKEDIWKRREAQKISRQRKDPAPESVSHSGRQQEAAGGREFSHIITCRE